MTTDYEKRAAENGTVTTAAAQNGVDIEHVWRLALSYMRSQTSRADFQTWVEPLIPLGCDGKVFSVGVSNPYHRDFVISNLKSTLDRILSATLGKEVSLEVKIANPYYTGEVKTMLAAPPDAVQRDGTPAGSAGPACQGEPPLAPAKADSPRKIALRRSYGDRRAAIIQPERGLFVTQYLFNRWLPLLKHSALAVILAARSLCYWNPLNGEKRNEISLTMDELAGRAAVSVRTLKSVLAMPLVRRHFLRYQVRRIVTAAGVRTAGIELVVRMDDPLAPGDGEDDEQWFPERYQDEEEGDTAV